jgi:hypothetical protein
MGTLVLQAKDGRSTDAICVRFANLTTQVTILHYIGRGMTRRSSCMEMGIMLSNKYYSPRLSSRRLLNLSSFDRSLDRHYQTIPTLSSCLPLFHQLPHSNIQTLNLALCRIPTSCPPNSPIPVRQVYIPHTPIHGRNRSPNLIIQPLPHQKIPPPFLLSHLPSQRPHEQPYQQRLQPIRLHIHPHNLCDIFAFACQNVVQRGIHFLSHKSRRLVLTPEGRPYCDDRHAVYNDRGGI